MFALDLFNNDHERRLAEGAVDQLEQRRIDDLAMRMDDLVARAKQATTTEVKQALMKEFQKCKAERDSYHMVRNETMGYGTLTGEGQVTPTATGIRHHARPENYGGYQPEPELKGLNKTLTKNLEKGMGIEFKRSKKFGGGIDVDEAGIPGNVPVEKIPGKEDLLKGKGRSYYEANQKKNSELDEARLAVGDPIVVTAPNEFEGKTGEIYEFSPSGSFVIVDLYNHGQHSMHLSDVKYNDYADQEETDDWYDDIDDGPQHAYDSDERTRSDQFEGFQDFNKVEPYAVCLSGKPVKKFDYYEQARRFHDNWKQKLYREGNKEKADKITLMPLNLDEAGSPAQQAAIAIAMKKAGKKPKQVDELSTEKLAQYKKAAGADASAADKAGNFERGNKRFKGIVKATNKQFDNDAKKQQGVAEDTGSWIVYDPETKQIKKRFKTHTAGKSYARTHGLDFASSEYYFDNIKQAVTVEAIVASGPSRPLDDRAVRKLVWDTMKINADTGEQALQQALSMLAKKPQSRMVQNLKDKFQNLADRLEQGLAETVTDVKSQMAKVYNRLAPKIERHRDSFLAGQLYDELENIAELHGAEDEFKRMMAGARNRAHMDYDTNPGGFQNWFWYLPFEREELSEEQDTSGVERAILNRIMVAHTDLLMKFGPDKVMQAAEEVAYNVGDVDEIGTSDVSAYVNQVKQILGVEA